MMPTIGTPGAAAAAPAAGAEAGGLAMRRWEVLRPHVQDGVPLARTARDAGVPPRTAQRWLAAFRIGGLAALGRQPRADAGRLRTQAELVEVIQGLALMRPRPSVATIARKTAALAAMRGWSTPAYSTVRQIVAAIDPHLLCLAHDGPTGFRDRYELVHRRQAERPNQVWQADHTELDVLVLDERGYPARPWLTVVIDDCSRAVCGYTVFLGAPSALNLSLALRQAVRPKADPGWVVSGLPEVLYADHGSDFTSGHLRQVCADLHVRLIYSAAARPQGRGKVERLFGTITTELLPLLPGHLVHGKPATAPALTLPALDAARARWLTGYHQRTHSETGLRPPPGGSPTGGCPEPPTPPSSWTCSWSWSQHPASCTATASASKGSATWTPRSPPTSERGSPSATTPATWPRSASTTRTPSCVGPSAPPTPARQWR